NNLPNRKITWIVEPAWSELVEFHPMIDKMIVFNRPKNLLGVLNLYKILAREHFDIVFDLQRHFKSGFFSLLSGAKRRIGFNRNNAKELNWIFNNEHIEDVGDELLLPKWRHYLKFTEYIGLPEPAFIDFGFASLDVETIAPSIITRINDPLIAVVIGTSWKSKEWFFQGYYELINNILSSGSRRVVLLGDRSKTAYAAALCEKVDSRGLINLIGKTSLLELVAVLKTADAGVGPDSGPAHLAAAVGTPFVTIFGPTPPRRLAPYKCEHLVVQADLSCVSCYKKKCPDLDRRCMRLISPKAVMEKLTDALTISRMD
ncbi:MAG: glycosyltransferase family 9 protein, partial [Deltaproteobacteria bacterium]|nr:glycosyltransferase family 9 protein [Deltaproteobacteria bacterium]